MSPRYIMIPYWRWLLLGGGVAVRGGNHQEASPLKHSQHFSVTLLVQFLDALPEVCLCSENFGRISASILGSICSISWVSTESYSLTLDAFMGSFRVRPND